MRGHSRLYGKQWYDINGIQLHPTMKDNFTNINHNLKKHLELSFGIPKKGTPRLLSTKLFFLRIRIRQDHYVSALGEVCNRMTEMMNPIIQLPS